jgi:hypothetical protein
MTTATGGRDRGQLLRLESHGASIQRTRRFFCVPGIRSSEKLSWATCINLLRKRTRFGFCCQMLRQSADLTVADQRRWCVLLRGPGGRYVSTTSSDCFTGFVTFCLRTLLRGWRIELLPFRGLYRTGSSLLLRRQVLLSGPEPLLRTVAAVLPVSSKVLPTGSKVLPIGSALRELV